ncbi:FERM RhoGEF and pleckstrin domain-containing protein 2 [Fasciola hepatica]|uniref:FERM RhoGEF and pleckstrin domain-containing protein 2 n=1 Tax=Fasciola hepatica TaxID=6192 RepID=A0A4E0RZJ2_FASHE|nr:FERM RhoGEF and pleckstrin domain-containing protein 2 [Fasciola hepatica]
MYLFFYSGLTKEEADYRLLDAARKVELYGVRLHPVKDAADQPFNLAVTHAGVLVFQQFSRVNTFMWSKIRKLSFNRHKFLIKLHTGDQSYLRDTVEYTFPTRNSCKNFWRKCIEQHAFFRSVTSLFPVNGSTGRSVGLLDSFRSGSLSSVRRLRRSASCGATEQIDSLHSSVSRTSDRPTSSGQVSQMSTPVRRFARIRQHTASLKLFNKQQKRILDELQSPCLLSETKPAWALPEHPYTLPKQSTPGCKPVGVAKLLSNCPNPTAEYFQLLRLSFTSLIPESVSALDSGHTTPAASSRMRTLERMRERAVSTPSIHQPDVPKRKRSCHAFVPRQFNPLGSGTLPGARLKSQTSDDTLDLSASRTFPKRPDLDEVANCLQQRDKIGGNHIANGTSPPSLTASTEVYRVNGYHLHRTPSSSCSLASDMSPTPLSENETTLNDICGFVSPRDPRGSWLDGCGENEDAWSVSSREPVLSNLVSSGVNDPTNTGLLT